MKFSKKSKFVLFMLLTVLNVIMRLPLNHERGVDSFFIHALATSISEYGYAKWVIHPTSLMGFYPLSYPSASPFLLSGISQVLGLNIEHTILIFCVILGITSVFFTFSFAREIKNDDLFAFLVAFIFSFSPVFLAFTMWQASTRNLFMTVLPLFLWSLVKCNKSFSTKHLIISIIALFLLLVSHRLSMFLSLIFISFILSYILIKLIKFIRNKKIFIINQNIVNKIAIFSFFVVIIFSFLIQFSGIGFYNNWLSDFYSGYLFNSEKTHFVILNIFTDYIGKIGILLIFGLVGIIYLAKNMYKNFGKLFVGTSLILLTPFLVLEDYTPEFILVFYSIIVGLGLLVIYDNLKVRKRLVYPILISCILISTGFSFYMLDHMRVFESTFSDNTQATAIFLEDNINSSIVANSGILSSQLYAFSGKPCLPYGGAYAQPNSPEQLVHGIVRPKDVSVKPTQLENILSERTFYKLLGSYSNSKVDWAKLMSSSPCSEETNVLSSKYNTNYLVENTQFSGKYWHWETYHSRMLVSLHYDGDKIYFNGKKNVWYLDIENCEKRT